MPIHMNVSYICTVTKGSSFSVSRSDDEAEEEEDERIPLPFSGIPSRERHIADMRPPRTLGVIKRKDFVKRILFVSFVAFLGLLVILFTVVAHTLSSEDQPDTCQNVESGRYLFDPYTNEQNFRLCHSKEARLTGSLGQAIAGKGSTSVEKRSESYARTHVCPTEHIQHTHGHWISYISRFMGRCTYLCVAAGTVLHMS